jgi:hypothetical protein
MFGTAFTAFLLGIASMDSTLVASVINHPPRQIFVPLTPTLSDFRPDIRIEALAESAGQSFEFVRTQLFDDAFRSDCRLGEFGLETMLEEIRARLDADLTEAHLQGLWALAYEPNLQAIDDLLERFGTRLRVLIAGSPLLKAGLAAYLPEIAGIGADGMVAPSSTHVFTHEFGLSCSEPKLYCAIMGASNRAAADFALLDTNPSFSEAAATAGWQVLAPNGPLMAP